MIPTGKRKFTFERAEALRKEFRDGSISISALVRREGLTRTHMHKLLRGLTYLTPDVASLKEIRRCPHCHNPLAQEKV